MKLDPLKGRVFEGFFNGRRIRDGKYYDVVELPAWESDIAAQFSRIVGVRGFTSGGGGGGGGGGEPQGPALWTKLAGDTPLGCHWFVVRGMNDGRPELESMRHLPDREPFEKAPAAAREPMPPLDLRLLTEGLTIVITLVLSLVVGAFKIVEFTGTFIINFILASSMFVERSTPMFGTVLDCVRRIAAGFFTLVAMLFQGFFPVRPQNRRPERKHYDAIEMAQ